MKDKDDKLLLCILIGVITIFLAGAFIGVPLAIFTSITAQQVFLTLLGALATWLGIWLLGGMVCLLILCIKILKDE